MTEYRLTRQADADLNDLFEYSLVSFGLNQARRYVASIKEAFALIATQPDMGRGDLRLGPDVRRHEHGSHVILYTASPDGVLILSVVHARRMLQRPS